MTKSARTVLAALAALCLLAAAHDPASASAVKVLKYKSGGYSYMQVSHGALAGFEQPTFDASGWAIGRAGFGTTTATCPWNNTTQVKTHWDPDTDMLLRHTVVIPVGTRHARIVGTVDNSVDVYLNGTFLGHVDDGSCHAKGISISVPRSVLLDGDNLLALRASDSGGADFIDVQMTAS